MDPMKIVLEMFSHFGGNLLGKIRTKCLIWISSFWGLMLDLLVKIGRTIAGNLLSIFSVVMTLCVPILRLIRIQGLIVANIWRGWDIGIKIPMLYLCFWWWGGREMLRFYFRNLYEYLNINTNVKIYIVIRYLHNNKKSFTNF